MIRAHMLVLPGTRVGRPSVLLVKVLGITSTNGNAYGTYP
jgi:hypothetical protein